VKGESEVERERESERKRKKGAIQIIRDILLEGGGFDNVSHELFKINFVIKGLV